MQTGNTTDSTLQAGIKSEHDPVQQRLRHEVAAVTRILNRQGLLGYSGHVSVRLPDQRTFLIQPIQQSRAELSPEHLLMCEVDSGSARGGQHDSPPSEVFIHSEIYKVRPDVQAIAHFHHDLTTIFSVVEGVELQPIKNHAMRWRSGIPIHPNPGHVNTQELGKSLATTLGPHNGAIIRAHGQVIVSDSLPTLLMECIHFTENAETAYKAATLGKVIPLTPAEMEEFAKQFKRKKVAAKLWIYYTGLGQTEGFLPKEWFSALEYSGSTY